nr:nuclear transport factor 2 family protein [Phyllobacterium myrsinacearum]
MDAIASKENPVTFFSPAGDFQEGADIVSKRYRHDAKTFAAGSKSRLVIHQMAARGDIAWWTGLQIADVKMKGKDKAVSMTLRITETFRFEDGWKLVHRHADMAKEGK